jgi:L-amino acid N-acyltransferase YncA
LPEPAARLTSCDIVVAPMRPEDWDAVRAIYVEGIATGNSTFEQNAPDWQTWDQGHLPCCRLVARAGSEILGWTALSLVSRRQVYAGVAEFSIYVAQRARGRGIGAVLLKALIGASEREGIWTLQSGIFPENTASLELCRRFGFRVVGTRERIGNMNGRWRDVVLLERRSVSAGV